MLQRVRKKWKVCNLARLLKASKVIKLKEKLILKACRLMFSNKRLERRFVSFNFLILSKILSMVTRDF